MPDWIFTADKPGAVQAADFDQMQVGGSVLAPGLVSEVKLDLSRARIAGRLSLFSLPGRRTKLTGGLTATEARLAGTVDLRGAYLDGGLTLLTAVVRGDL